MRKRMLSWALAGVLMALPAAAQVPTGEIMMYSNGVVTRLTNKACLDQ